MRPFFSRAGMPSAATLAAMSAAMPLTASALARLNFAMSSVADISGLILHDVNIGLKDTDTHGHNIMQRWSECTTDVASITTQRKNCPL
jgi:hypothetical protein